jgi:hypothetical protein
MIEVGTWVKVNGTSTYSQTRRDKIGVVVRILSNDVYPYHVRFTTVELRHWYDDFAAAELDIFIPRIPNAEI